MTRIKDLEIFVEVANQGHFARASDKLHTSPASVSRSLGRLEDALRTPLLIRDSRQVLLTPAGKQVYRFAKDMLRDWQDLRNQFRFPGQLTGQIRLFCTITASYTLLREILVDFRRQYAQVDISVMNGDAADAVAAVQQGNADVAIAPYQEPWPQHLAWLPLQQVPLVWVYPIDFKEQTPWWSEPIIAPENGPIRKLLDQHLKFQPEAQGIQTVVSSHEAVLALVALEFGVGLVPSLVFSCSGLQTKVRQVRADDSFGSLQVGLCVKKSRLEDPLLQRFWSIGQQCSSQSDG